VIDWETATTKKHLERIRWRSKSGARLFRSRVSNTGRDPRSFESHCITMIMFFLVSFFSVIAVCFPDSLEGILLVFHDRQKGSWHRPRFFHDILFFCYPHRQKLISRFTKSRMLDRSLLRQQELCTQMLIERDMSIRLVILGQRTDFHFLFRPRRFET